MKIDVLTFDAASGHKSAAEAFRRQLKETFPDGRVRVIDLDDVARSQSPILGWIHPAGIRYFNWCMRNERYFLFPTAIRSWIRFARLNTRVRSLRFLLKWTSRFWNGDPPDAIVSVTPMLHTVVYESARVLNPQVRCITVPVDYSEMSPGYWFQPKISQHYLLGCNELYETARGYEIGDEQVTRLSGMAIDPLFYEDSPIDHAALCEELGLDPQLPIGVISFGGQGTVNVLKCAQEVIQARIPVNLICLTGRNQNLKTSVESLQSEYPIVAREFRAEPPVEILRAAAFLIGKPGTMTLNEALISQTVFIFLKSQGLHTLQHANEEWVLKQGIGLEARTHADIPKCVKQALQRDEFLPALEAAQHRGIFEAVERIHQLLNCEPQSEKDTSAVSHRLHT